MKIQKYIRYRTFPTPWCPGCGDGVILKSIAMAFADLNLEPDDIVVVAGIGCSSWIPSPYFLADTLHTTHGRAIAYATGVRAGAPERKKVMVHQRRRRPLDIGGNHLIHAARRNTPSP